MLKALSMKTLSMRTLLTMILSMRILLMNKVLSNLKMKRKQVNVLTTYLQRLLNGHKYFELNSAHINDDIKMEVIIPILTLLTEERRKLPTVLKLPNNNKKKNSEDE